MKHIFLKLSTCFYLLLALEMNAQMAFFYQTVGPFVAGTGLNTVEVGTTNDGINIETNNVSALKWYVGLSADSTYGDPVFSYLPNGNWSITAWTGASDPRGAGRMLYYESPCPIVVDTDVIDLGASTAVGCQVLSTIQIGKTSQMFEVGSRTYVMHSTPTNGIHIACMSDAINSAMDLTELCVKLTAYSTLAELNYGETMPIYSSDSLLLSDVAIAKRLDGTWVLFMKGISDTSTCVQGSLCELAARGIYRTTSTDFINWTPLEKVVSKASVPEASTAVDGTVWLYWQDFTTAVAANDLMLASVAPISGAYELPVTYQLSTSIQTTFYDEPFQTNSSIHYATNANPIYLPDATAINSLQSCIIANGGSWLGIDENGSIESSLNIYPNPFNSFTTIQMSKELSNAEINIYDIYGIKISTINNVAGQVVTLYRETLPSGMYFVYLTQAGKMIATKKLLITD